MIPAAALEAAAKAYYPHFWKPSEPVENYDKEPEFIKEKVRNFVRPILEAAAPEMYAPVVALADTLASMEEVPSVMVGITIRAEVASLLRL